MPGDTGAPPGMPMSTTVTSPAWPLPGWIHSPGLDAAGHVGGDHGRVRGVDGRDGGGHVLARGAAEAGAEHRVDHDAGALQHRGIERPGLLAGEPLEVRARVALQLLRVGGGQHAHDAPQAPQQARGDVAVAAVVAAAADDDDRPVGGHLGGQLRETAAGALHQLDARHAAVLDRPAVGLAHLLRVR
jgi:hypothetical protein